MVLALLVFSVAVLSLGVFSIGVAFLIEALRGPQPQPCSPCSVWSDLKNQRKLDVTDHSAAPHPYHVGERRER
jgi:hypothetical protein